jgi:hypothetical protein
MVSESTWKQAGCDWAGRELALLRVVGRQMPVRVFELAGLPGEAPPASWDLFEQGRLSFAQGRFAAAQRLFEALPLDPAACAYLRKCRLLCANPPETWTGIWELSEK